jgi:large subunit ribosomal protein L29
MKADKVRELDSNEIAKQLKDGTEQNFRIRFQLSMGQAEGVNKLRTMRKDRARMLTILRERALNPEANPEPAPAKKAAKGKKK